MVDHSQRILWDSMRYVRYFSTTEAKLLNDVIIGQTVGGQVIAISAIGYKTVQNIGTFLPNGVLRELTPIECEMVDRLLATNILDTIKINWSSMRRTAHTMVGTDLSKKYTITISTINDNELHDIMISISLADHTLLAVRPATDAEIPIIARRFRTLPLE